MPALPRLPVLGGFPDWVAAGRFDPQYRLPDGFPSDTGTPVLYLIWQGNRLLFPDRAEAFPLQAIPAGFDAIRCSVLGSLDGRPCYAVDIAADVPAPHGFQWMGLRALFNTLDHGLVALAGRSFQVLEWERTHQYCGRCATPMQMRGNERARACPACGFVAYPRISPVVMGLVIRERELLLARSPHFAPGMYSAVAGFVEVGESLEQALVREIKEETGIHADEFQYFDSQPWPFPHSLMVAFTAEYVDGDPVPQPEEIEDVQWFAVDRLPLLPPPISIAGRLIRAVAAHLCKGTWHE